MCRNDCPQPSPVFEKCLSPRVQTEHDTDVIFVVTRENKIYFYTVLLKLGKVKMQFYRYKRLIEAGADHCQAQISLC